MSRTNAMKMSIGQVVEFRDTDGRLCGTYHYDDPYKSFFRGLFTPNGLDVVARESCGEDL